MAISGLVLTLDGDFPSWAPVQSRLERDSRITIGNAVGRKLPVVTETSTLEEGEALFDELRQLRGVDFVDVVSVDFSDEEATRGAS